MYTIEFISKRVQKELTKLSYKDQEIIKKAIKVLESDPRPFSLQYSPLNIDKSIKRVKCKRARLFYLIDDSRKLIQIGKIQNRDSHSYNNYAIKDWFSGVA
ncbi:MULTISPECIES: type II toxin-antitoxin system RelE family toxin [Metabacillus]|uniref:type II toxin-antitoxin system RelE family toxin n=1 Tax=Metabacillus TaxID=2675233 RepID=UPI001BA14005|nr:MULTISPECIES: hypothetical protein [Metabacillus]MCM3164698.1 hypothetical protein [Metabacillus litoralis]UGB33624.1 hypothetical protein LPC09_27200 [Metabacillus sp. B2-18]